MHTSAHSAENLAPDGQIVAQIMSPCLHRDQGTTFSHYAPTPTIGLTGVVPWAPPLSPCSGYSGDNIHPSTIDKQPKPHYLLTLAEGLPGLLG